MAYRPVDPDSAPAAISRWSTASVEAGQRVDYFEAALAASLIPTSVAAADPESFDLTVTAAGTGPVSAARIGGSQVRVVRSRSDLSRSGAETFHLLSAVSSPCRLRLGGERLSLVPGQSTVVDSRLVHDFEFAQDHENSVLTLPASWMRQWVPAPEVLVGSVLAHRATAWSTTLQSFATGLTPEFMARPPLPHAVVADQLGALLALAAHDFSGVLPARNSRAERSLADAVREQVRACASLASLGAGEVATALGVSSRTLHRALAAERQTFGGILMACRAEIAWRILRSTTMDRLTIAEVGFRAGFVDASHFARVMKARYGMTPRRIRQVRMTRA